MQRIVELLQPVVASKDELSQEPVLLRGIDAIAGRFFEILSTSSDITLMVRKALKVKGVFSEYLEAFPLSGKRIRLLLPSKPPINERDARLLSRLKIETRYYDHPVLDMMVADELDVVLGVPERSNDEPFSAVALWVRNPSFARSTRAAIDEIWEESSKRRGGARHVAKTQGEAGLAGQEGGLQGRVTPTSGSATRSSSPSSRPAACWSSSPRGSPSSRWWSRSSHSSSPARQRPR